MNKLGTDTWERLKKTTKKKVKDIARDLIKLYAVRKAQTGNSFSPDSYLQTELEASFIYEDTPDQEKQPPTLKRIWSRRTRWTGSFAAMWVSAKPKWLSVRRLRPLPADSKQVAILVPTTILAAQHYKTFTDRLKGFPCNIDYVNRFKSSKQIKDTLEKLANGKVAGYHHRHVAPPEVSKDVKFKDLGLMIIDEEQKFGVSTKEKLKQMRANVDTLNG